MAWGISCFETLPWVKWAILIQANYKICKPVSGFFFSPWVPKFNFTLGDSASGDQLIIRIWARLDRSFIILIPLRLPCSTKSHGFICDRIRRLVLLITYMIKCNNTHNEGPGVLCTGKDGGFESVFSWDHLNVTCIKAQLLWDLIGCIKDDSFLVLSFSTFVLVFVVIIHTRILLPARLSRH